MTIQAILQSPDPLLRQIAKPVPSGWLGLRGLVRDMVQTLRASGGIGLAAPQIGKSWRVAIVDLSQGVRPPIVLVNPVLSKMEGSAAIEEGCLSVPDRRILVPRAASLEVTAHDEKHRLRRFSATGLLAICIQHEVDHLDGKLILDADPVQPLGQ